MNERVKQLSREEPYLRSYFTMMDKMWDSPEASAAYIDTQTALIAKPATQEEAFRLVGRMYMEGLDCVASIGRVSENGVFKLMVIPADLTAVIGKTQDIEAGRKIMGWIAEGMDVAEQDMSNSEEYIGICSKLRDMTADDIYAAIIKAWNDQRVYVSEEALAQYNAGRAKPLSRQDVTDWARLTLNYPMSYYIARKYVTDVQRQRYQQLAVTVRNAFRKRLQAVDWISETTRSNAIEKLDNMKLNMGAPDTWYTEYIPQIDDCATFVEMVHRLRRSKNQLEASLLGGSDYFTSMLLASMDDSSGRPMPTDLTWNNGKYQMECNAIFFYPALLMPPFLDESVSMARQYAAMAAIGHEITHGFDSEGAKYDKYGKNYNWWTDADKTYFVDRQQKLIDSYNGLLAEPEQLPGVYCDGKLTLEENIADLGGFLAARDAYIDYLHENGYTGETYRLQLRSFY